MKHSIFFSGFIFFTSIFLLIFSACNFAQRSQETTSGSALSKVASINGEEVNEKDLLDSIPGHLRNYLINRLIEERLIEQLARNKGIIVSEKEINDAVKEYVKNRMSHMNLEQKSLSREIRKNLLREKIKQKVITGIEVSDKDAQSYYEKNKSRKYTLPARFKIQKIVIMYSSENRNAQMQKASQALSRINGGEDFAKIAGEYSSDSLKGKPQIVSGKYLSRMEKRAIKTLKSGETSAIITTPNSFILIKLLEKFPQSIKSFDEVKDEISEQLVKREQNKKWTEWFRKYKSEAKIIRF